MISSHRSDRFVASAAAVVVCICWAGLQTVPDCLAETPAAASRVVRVTYQTDSARLNKLLQERDRANWLPEFTICTIDIRYPHPLGDPDVASATVTVEAAEPTSERAGVSSRAWGLWGASNSRESDGTPRPPLRQVWNADLPTWQIDALISQLRRDRFFDRVKIPGARAKLIVELDGRKFGKDFKPVDDLDSLIFRVRGEGRKAGPSVANLGPVLAPPVSSPGAVRVTRLPPPPTEPSR